MEVKYKTVNEHLSKHFLTKQFIVCQKILGK